MRLGSSLLESAAGLAILLVSAAGLVLVPSFFKEDALPPAADCTQTGFAILERIRVVSRKQDGLSPMQYLAIRYNGSQDYCSNARLMDREDPLLQGMIRAEDNRKVALRLQTFSRKTGKIGKCPPKPLDVRSGEFGFYVTLDLGNCQVQDSFF